MALFSPFIKKTLRDRMLKQRSELSDLDRQIKSRAIISHILLHIPAGVAVAGYHAIRGEVDIATLMKVLSEKGNRMCLPVVTHKDAPLTFKAWSPGNELVKGSYGIMEPVTEASVLVPDVLLVPLVAFDARCHRLGYGAGYYDRTIAQLRKKNSRLRAIGIAYGFQQANDMPIEKHDQKLTMVITENGVIQAR